MSPLSFSLSFSSSPLSKFCKTCTDAQNLEFFPRWEQAQPLGKAQGHRQALARPTGIAKPNPPAAPGNPKREILFWQATHFELHCNWLLHHSCVEVINLFEPHLSAVSSSLQHYGVDPKSLLSNVGGPTAPITNHPPPRLRQHHHHPQTNKIHVPYQRKTCLAQNITQRILTALCTSRHCHGIGSFESTAFRIGYDWYGCAVWCETRMQGTEGWVW